MKCLQCSSNALERATMDHHYVECGLPNVHLHGVPARRCMACQAVRLMIPAIEELHRVIALAVLRKRSRLTGAEVRYLRKYIGLSGQDFAKRIGVSPEIVSKWENEHTHIGPQSERLLRLLVVNMAQVQEYPIDELDLLSAESEVPAPMTFERGSRDWHRAAHC